MQANTPRFPEVIDNTMRSDFFDCPQKFKRSFIDQLGGVQPSADLHAGGAYAAGLEAGRTAFYRDGIAQMDATLAAIDAAVVYWGDFQPPDYKMHKNIDRVIEALVYYFDTWPLADDVLKPYIVADQPSIEFTFAIPLPIPHPVTGQPIIYAGRCDMIAQYGEALWVVDDKTTTQLGASWPGKWTLRSQFTGYVWAARKQANLPVTGAVIRGVAFLKNGFNHAQAFTARPQWLIDSWYTQLLRDIGKMINCWHEGYWDYAYGEACVAYGGCPFQILCNSPNPEDWIEGNFKPRVWQPLAKVPPGYQGDQEIPAPIPLPAGVAQ
jgi:PD-(D/E)XK nuclease superfamily